MWKNKPSQLDAPTPRQEGREDMVDRALTVNQLEGKRKVRPPHRRSSLRAGLAVVAGRASGALSRRLHLGGGTSIVGVVAQSIYPEIIRDLALQLEHGSVLVTGTNGKTTTSSFLAAIVRDGGLRVWRNREGSNLARGVASSLVIRALPNGKLRRAGKAISILEVDEAALSQIVQVVPPRVTVFTNLFRDQLDRYGEVNTVMTRWKQAIADLPETSILVLNADDPAIASLGEHFAGKTLYFGIDDTSLDLQNQGEERNQVIDTRTCFHCGKDFEYEVRFYSHMGHYLCPHCGLRRPQPDVRATHIELESFDRIRVRISTGTQQREIVIPLPGLYNIYNALAAITSALALGIEWDPIVSGIEQFKPVFGRGERIQAEGRTIRFLLAKNPTGFNEVIRTLFSDSIPRHLLFVLNDNPADGKDISWIWDVDFERIVGQSKGVIVSGTRALDLALRLKYAGLAEDEMDIVPAAPLQLAKKTGTARQYRGIHSPKHVNRTNKEESSQQTAQLPVRTYGLQNALNIALEQTPAGETLFVVPTYTGLLEVHHELESRGLTPHYWEGKDA